MMRAGRSRLKAMAVLGIGRREETGRVVVGCGAAVVGAVARGAKLSRRGAAAGKTGATEAAAVIATGRTMGVRLPERITPSITRIP